MDRANLFFIVWQLSLSSLPSIINLIFGLVWIPRPWSEGTILRVTFFALWKFTAFCTHIGFAARNKHLTSDARLATDTFISMGAFWYFTECATHNWWPICAYNKIYHALYLLLAIQSRGCHCGPMFIPESRARGCPSRTRSKRRLLSVKFGMQHNHIQRASSSGRYLHSSPFGILEFLPFLTLLSQKRAFHLVLSPGVFFTRVLVFSDCRVGFIYSKVVRHATVHATKDGFYM